MKSLLEQISKAAIQLAEAEFSQEQIDQFWIGSAPSTSAEIEKVEMSLGISFPEDYTRFLSITDGFAAPNDIEPTFAPIKHVDFLRKIDENLIEVNTSLQSPIAAQLQHSVVLGGINEEQYFLLVPSSNKEGDWAYWKFANWLPQEEEYHCLDDYFEEVLSFLNGCLKARS